MCESIETTQFIERSANGRFLIVSNPGYREIGIVKVDGCLINDASRRVDWIVRIPVKKKAKSGWACQKLVELKGYDVPHAVTQVEATLRHAALADTVHLVDECFIVSQQKPAMASSIQVALFDFRSRFNVPIRIVPKAMINAAFD